MSANNRPPTTNPTVTSLNDYRDPAAANDSGTVRVVHDEPAPLFAHALVPGFVASHGAAGHVSLRDRCESEFSDWTASQRHLRSVN